MNLVCTALPKAYLGQAKAFLPDKVVRICASCPDREWAEVLALSEGNALTHGMCDECFATHMAALVAKFSATATL